jgi:sulfite reductase (NADPH) flavoprotein alpha-component
MQQDGTLTRLDTAFSRDQAHKIYVQDRMREHAGELYAWIERGAYFYVCGDAVHMAKSVEEALTDATAQGRNITREDAAAYVDAMKKQRRYQRDVY